MTRFHFQILYSAEYINLVFKKISQIKPIVQVPIRYFMIPKKTHVSIRHNIILISKKSSVSFFSIDSIYMVYLIVGYFLVGYLSLLVCLV